MGFYAFLKKTPPSPVSQIFFVKTPGPSDEKGMPIHITISKNLTRFQSITDPRLDQDPNILPIYLKSRENKIHAKRVYFPTLYVYMNYLKNRN